MEQNKNKKEKKQSLKEKFSECEKQRDEYLAGWQRAKADFLNYKKEEAERTKELIKQDREKLILKMLPILDNFELLEKELPPELKDNQYIKGTFQIKKQIVDLLKSQGVERIKGVGEKFDPNFHEVIQEIEDKDKESGIIIEEVQKGYRIKSRLLRPAKVKVVK